MIQFYQRFHRGSQTIFQVLHQILKKFKNQKTYDHLSERSTTVEDRLPCCDEIECLIKLLKKIPEFDDTYLLFQEEGIISLSPTYYFFGKNYGEPLIIDFFFEHSKDGYSVRYNKELNTLRINCLFFDREVFEKLFNIQFKNTHIYLYNIEIAKSSFKEISKIIKERIVLINNNKWTISYVQGYCEEGNIDNIKMKTFWLA